MTTTTATAPPSEQLPAVESGLGRYRTVLATPGVLAFAVPGLIGRLPMGMLSLAQVMLIATTTGSYGLAGAVAACGALTYAVVTPQTARLADRHGQARVLLPLVAVFAVSCAALAVCAVGRAPVWTLFVAGALSRGTMPALGAMVRSRWSHALRDSSLLDSAFSLEGIADELIFIGGPVLVVALVTHFDPVTGVLACAALSLVGVIGLTRRRHAEPPAAPGRHARGGALRSPGLRVLIGMYMCLGALFATVDMGVISFAQDHGGASLAGPLLGLYGVGSAIAGIWYGARHWRSCQSTRLLAALAATVVGTAPLALMPGIWSMAVAILIAGLGISATLISSHSIALAVVPAEHRTEGLTWLTTAASAGTALGAPLSGRLIDAYGPGAGFLFAFGAGLLALTVTVLRRRSLTA